MSYHHNSTGINVSASRFSALKIENDDDSFIEVKSTKNKKKNTNNRPSTANNSNNNNNNTNSNKQKKHSTKKTNAGNNGSKNGNSLETNDNSDWTAWKEKDEEFTEQMYKDQMKNALIESKLQFEAEKKKKSNEADLKQTKLKPMSLEEFHKSIDNGGKKQHQHNDKASEIKSIIDVDEEFAKQIDANLDKLIEREKSTIEINDQNIIEKYLNLQYKEEIEKRDKHIEKLKIDVTVAKNEIIEVRKRNKQLAFILAQGEMKEKSELLMQIEDLMSIKDDLTIQISELDKNLKQEKSRVHQLENELKTKSITKSK